MGEKESTNASKGARDMSPKQNGHKKQSSSTPTNGTPGDGSEQNGVLSDAMSQTVAEDPLAKFFQQRWREIVAVIFVAFAFTYGRDVFQQTRLESLRRSADVLLDLQSQVEELKVLSGEIREAREAKPATEEEKAEKASDASDADTKSSKEISESEKDVSEDTTPTADELEFQRGSERARELIRALSQERDPYGELAGMYDEVVSALVRDLQEGSYLSALSSEGVALGDIASFQARINDGVLGEIAAFQYALSELQNTDGKDGTVPGAIEKLSLLVQHGNFTGVAALSVLHEVTESNPEALSRERFDELRGAYLERHPEQAPILRKELPL
jgi:hypothetical protein